MLGCLHKGSGLTMEATQKERRIQEILALVGDPKQVALELEAFKKQARLFSAHRPRLIDRYQKQWVAVYDGEVKAQARTLPGVLKQIDAKGLPREHTLIRYIDKNVRTFIL
jgi:hypothetical protein